MAVLYTYWITQMEVPVAFYQGIAVLVVVFFGAIFVYFFLNTLSVPKVDSMDTLRDNYTRTSSSTKSIV